MIPFSSEPKSLLNHNGRSIASFDIVGPNLDEEIVGSFGAEWKRFDWFSDAAIEVAGTEYFDIVPKELLATVGHALDAGCGSGRWSRYLSTRVGFVESIDPSEAVLSASELNRDRPNVRVTRASIDTIPFADGSFDFAICLGVIHHLPDPALALLAPAGLVLRLSVPPGRQSRVWRSCPGMWVQASLPYQLSAVRNCAVSGSCEAIIKSMLPTT